MRYKIVYKADKKNTTSTTMLAKDSADAIRKFKVINAVAPKEIVEVFKVSF